MSKTKKQRKAKKKQLISWKPNRKVDIFYVSTNWPSRGFRGKQFKNKKYADKVLDKYVAQMKFPFDPY